MIKTLNKADQAKVEVLMRNLDLSEQEAIELIEFDNEVNKMSVKEAMGDMPSVSKTQATEGTPTTKKAPAKKGVSGLTPNQELALKTLQESKEFMTGKQLSEATDGALNSRGLGSVMKKLIEKGIVEKKEGSPVQYKYIGE